MDDLTFFAGIRPSATILTVREYLSKTTGEVADYQLVFHVNYAKSLEKSFYIVEEFAPQNEHEEVARQELLDSYTARLEKIKTTPIDEATPFFQRVRDEDNNIVKGVKIHTETGKIHLFGFLIHKKPIKAGVYKEVNSSEKTLAKNKIEALTPVSKFRNFIVDRSTVIVSEGKHLIT